MYLRSVVSILGQNRFEEARLQLIALSTSPADEEYFLSSRRFWSKEELEVVENGGSGRGPTSPARRRPKTLPTWKTSRRLHNSGVALVHSSSIATIDSRTMQRGTRSRRMSTAERGSGIFYQDSGGSHPPVQSLEFPSQSRRLQGLSSGVRHKDSGPKDRAKHRNCGYVRLRVTRGCVQPGRKIDTEVTRHPSAALACITPDDIERLLLEVKPVNATTVVCAIVMSLLAPDDNVPENVCWPQGFEAMARDAVAFLSRLHETSGRAVNPFKARALRFVLQREDILPMVIEQQGAHTVARYSLC